MKRLLVIAAAALTLVAQAQNFPGTKPISIVVPFAAGGSLDTVARIVGQQMALQVGQSFIIDNRPGANAPRTR